MKNFNSIVNISERQNKTILGAHGIKKKRKVIKKKEKRRVERR